jgi:hypothetical protein
MSVSAESEPNFHLLLHPDEVQVTASALRLFISDEAHEPEIRRLAREAIAGLDGATDEFGVVSVALTPEQMKIVHSAVRLLLNDLQRGQAEEQQTLHAILQKLPDEHTMRAIQIK